MKEMKMKSNIVKTQSKNKVPLKECNKGIRTSSTLLSMNEEETLQIEINLTWNTKIMTNNCT
jgi:hypothetical protein